MLTQAGTTDLCLYLHWCLWTEAAPSLGRRVGRGEAGAAFPVEQLSPEIGLPSQTRYGKVILLSFTSEARGRGSWFPVDGSRVP